MGHKTSEIATAYRLEQFFDGIGDQRQLLLPVDDN